MMFDAAGLPWGKLDRHVADRSLAPRLSLVAHCIDVAAVMAALLALPTLRARLATLAGRPLTALDSHRLVALAFLHDVGKAGAGFQSRGLGDDERADWLRCTKAARDESGDVQVVAPLFEDSADFDEHRQQLGVDAILSWGGDTPSGQGRLCELWLAAISHHGAPVTLRTLQQDAYGRRWPTWTQPVAGYEPIRGLAQLGQAVRTLFAEAFDAEPFAPFGPGLVHGYAGLMSLADWIGSNTDDAFFPYELPGHGMERWPVARRRATEVLQRMHIDAEAARVDLRWRSPPFEQIFGVSPRDAQLQASAWSGERAAGRAVVLEAETGSGKTEAALWRFKTLFEAGEVDALCFLLPTRVAATGIYERLNRFVVALFPDPDLRPPTVLAVPGYLRANGDEGRPLPGFDVLWPDVEQRPHRSSQRPLYWAAENSKRYFAGCAVAGTIDQFLLSTLQVKHAHLRGSLALRALVVVDEVHASDAYMTTLLRAALDRHVRAGGHALLMSATLTGEARQRLLDAGQPRRPGGRSSILADPQAPYPAVSTRAGTRACAGTGRDKTIHIEVHPTLRDPMAVATCVAAEVARGARVLVLRNTVRQAVATQQALEALLGPEDPALFRVENVSCLHHGRYAFEDRRLLDAEVERLFGKAAVGSRDARALVGTQTLEISIDCDSDVMITDIAPIDVLLQRLGRLHRHQARDGCRPASASQPRVIVLTPPSRDLGPLLAASASRGLGIGARSAYDNLLAIEACLQLLEADRRWQVPRDNRRLVEAGASLQAWSDIADRLGPDWQAHFAAVCGKGSARAAQALPLLVHWHLAWGEGGWSELGDEARTRLGLDSVDLDLQQPWTTPLGVCIERISVPAWMLGGGVSAALSKQCETTADDGSRLLQLTVGETRLSYGRLGLQRL